MKKKILSLISVLIVLSSAAFGDSGQVISHRFTVDSGVTVSPFDLTVDGDFTADSISSTTPITDANVANDLTIDQGQIDDTPIGSSVPAQGFFTSLEANNLTLSTPLSDANVSNTLTASLFVGSGSSTTSVDLATAEIAGVLADANVNDALTISGGTIDNSPIGGSSPSTGVFSLLDVLFTGTTTNGVDINSDTISTGDLVSIFSNSLDPGARDLLQITNSNTASTLATGLNIVQSGPGSAMIANRGAISSANSMFDFMDAGTGAGATMQLTKTGAGFSTGGILPITRTGNFTGTDGGVANEFSINPSFTLTEPASGTFSYFLAGIDLTPLQVTAGAGTTQIAALHVNGSSDADIGTSYSLFTGQNGLVGIGNKLRFTNPTGTAITGTQYECALNNDSPKRYQCNVPTGALFEFSINDTAEAVLDNNSFNLQNNNLTTTGTATVGNTNITGAGVQVNGLIAQPSITSGTQTAQARAVNGSIALTGAAVSSGSAGNALRGGNFTCTHASTGTNAECVGVSTNVQVGGNASAIAAGTLTTAIGNRIQIGYNGGDLPASGAMTNAQGILMTTPNSTNGSRTMGTVTGLSIQDLHPTGVTNSFGIDISNQTNGGTAIRTGTGAVSLGDDTTITDADTGTTSSLTVTKSGNAYANNLGIVSVLRTGNYTIADGEKALDMQVKPTNTVTECASGTCIQAGAIFDMSAQQVTSGAGALDTHAFVAIAGSDTDAANNYALTSIGTALFAGFIRSQSQAVTIADNGTGAAASATLTPETNNIQITCNDANGCDVTMSETGQKDGVSIKVVNVSANTVNFADTAGVSELAASFAAGQYDAISMTYNVDRWTENSRSNN